MNRLKKYRFMMFAVLAAIFVFAMTGCSGDDGAQGPAGPAGPAGPVTTTNESCEVCHGIGRVAESSDLSTGMHYIPALPKVTITIDRITITTPGTTPTFNVTFTASGAALASYVSSTTAGLPGIAATNPTRADRLAFLRFAYAKLVTGATASGAAVARQTPQWVRYTSGDRDPSHILPLGGDQYTMSTPVDLADYENDQHTRLLLMVAAVDGATDPQNVIYDFSPDGVTPITVTRNLVAETACNKCHANLESKGYGISDIHEGSRYLVQACAVCHADRTLSASGSQGISLGREMVNLIHQVHSALNVRDDWSHVTFPQDVRNCAAICHFADPTDGFQGGLDGADSANYKDAPSGQACTSCHIRNSLNANGTMNHDPARVGVPPWNEPAGPWDDTSCTLCHLGLGTPNDPADIVTAHDTTPAPGSMNDPEFDVTLVMTAPTGSFYDAGDTVDFMITLVSRATGSPVDGSVYTLPQDAAGVSGGGLRVASLYVYGPRAFSLPLLGSQATPLFTGSTNTNITTDATGFRYRWVVPSGLEPGTYMVRFRAGDYSRVDDSDYRIESTAFQTYQIGTATETLKIDGNGCMKCHGTGTAPFHDARHSVVFDTDECVACHDLSGGYADFIGNRVHAIHKANSDGDLTNIDRPGSRDWSHVTFPQDPKRCVTCHNSGNTSYATKQYAIPCYGCHGDGLLGPARAHMLQSGGLGIGE